MTTLELISATANTTTAVTLGGTGGAAEYDMELNLYTTSHISVEVSKNGTNFSQGVSHAAGARYPVQAGSKVRLRNSDAVSAHDALVSYDRRR